MTIVNIRQNNVNIVDVTARNNSYTLNNVETLNSKEDLKKRLKRKRSIGLILNDVEVLEEDVTVPATVKKSQTIKDNARVKLNKDIKRDDDFVINVVRSIPDLSFDTVTYHIEAISEAEVIKSLEQIKNIEDIKKITLPQHAFFAISEAYYSGSTYLAVFIEETSNIIILASQGNLYFSRIGQFNIVDELAFDASERIKDIERTLLYVKQQYRQMNIEFIVIQDSLNDDATIVDQLAEISTIKVIPFETIKSKSSPDLVKKMTLEIGASIIASKNNFLPVSIEKAVKFHTIALVVLLLSFTMLLTSTFVFYNNYMDYDIAVVEHSKIKQDFIDNIDMINPLPQNQVNEAKVNIEGALKRQGDFLKNLTAAYPVTSFMKPLNIHYGTQDGESKLDIYFEQNFETLKALADFKKQFKDKVASIKKNNTMTVKTFYKTNYGELLFRATISISEKQRTDFDKLSTVGTPPL